MKNIFRTKSYVFACLILVYGIVPALATESVCRSKETGNTVNEIIMSYKKYKSNEKFINAYLKGVSRGFELGVQGHASHLPMSFQITEEGAGLNGLSVGYFHGLSVYCSMVGHDAKYRMP